MTREEAIKVLAVFKATYPNSYKGMTKEDAKAMGSVWAMQFHDIPLDIVMMAVYKLIATCQFPPSIAEMHQKLYKIFRESYYADSYGHLSEDQKQEMRRIKEALKRYDRQTIDIAEPSLCDIIKGGKLYIEGGN